MKSKYNKKFIDGLVAIIILFLISFLPVLDFVIVKTQYESAVSDMKTIEATIVDINTNMNSRWQSQEIYIVYSVDDFVYKKELNNANAISFTIWIGDEFTVGDKIEIFYNTENPEIIVAPFSFSIQYIALLIGLIGGIISVMFFIFMVKNSYKFRLGTKDKNDQK